MTNRRSRCLPKSSTPGLLAEFPSPRRAGGRSVCGKPRQTHQSHPPLDTASTRVVDCGMDPRQEVKSAAVECVARMAASVRASTGKPDSYQLDLYTLADKALADEPYETLVEMARDLLIYKGRQACNSGIQAPKYLGADAPSGKYPRAIPVDNKKTSVYVDFWHATREQLALAIGDRKSMALGCAVRAQNIAQLDEESAVLEGSEAAGELE